MVSQSLQVRSLTKVDTDSFLLRSSAFVAAILNSCVNGDCSNVVKDQTRSRHDFLLFNATEQKNSQPLWLHRVRLYSIMKLENLRICFDHSSKLNVKHASLP